MKLQGNFKVCYVRGHFRAQKSLDFQGPLLPMALEMDVAHIKKLETQKSLDNAASG